MSPGSCVRPSSTCSGFSLVAVLKVTESDIWLPVLFLVGGIAAFAAWKSIRWPDNWLKYMSFGAVFLLVCVLNRALYFLDYVVGGARLDDWPFYAHEPGWALFMGEVITIAGTLLTVLAWHMAGGAGLRQAYCLNRRDTPTA